MKPGHPPGPRHAARRAVARRHRRPRSSVSAASGAPRRSSGSCRASSRPPSATPVATPRTRPTRRSAPAGPATPRSCSSRTTRRRSATSSCSRCSGRTTTRPRACARATTSARSTARSSTPPTTSSGASPRRRATMYQEQLQAAGYGAITTEIADAGEPVLLRRGLPPAVSRQEPERLLPEPRDRREAARRLRGHAAAVRRLTFRATDEPVGMDRPGSFHVLQDW